jgi:hypothetical protein
LERTEESGEERGALIVRTVTAAWSVVRSQVYLGGTRTRTPVDTLTGHQRKYCNRTCTYRMYETHALFVRFEYSFRFIIARFPRY